MNFDSAIMFVFDILYDIDIALLFVRYLRYHLCAGFLFFFFLFCFLFFLFSFFFSFLFFF